MRKNGRKKKGRKGEILNRNSLLLINYHDKPSIMPRKGDSFFDHRKRMRYRRIKKKKKKSHKDHVSYEPGDKHLLFPGPLWFVMQCFRNFSLSHVVDNQTSRCKTSLFFPLSFLILNSSCVVFLIEVTLREEAMEFLELSRKRLQEIKNFKQTANPHVILFSSNQSMWSG